MSTSGFPLAGNPTGFFYGIGTCQGSFYIVRLTAWDAQTLPTGWSYRRLEPSDDLIYSHGDLHAAGFGFDWHGTDSTMAFAGVPIWLGFVFCALPALARYRRAMRWKKSGHCPGCGYDLRATPDQCPECGMAQKKMPIPN